jgi:dTDP-glucose 4,6-dehydratase
MHVLVTGGCGFIGSNFVRYVFDHWPAWRVTVFDSLTYAGNLGNLTGLLDSERVRFVHGDIADPRQVRETLEGTDAVANFAAESHVDRSILDSGPFIRTNVVGTQVLLNAARELGVERFLQVSTDEVYGSLGPDGTFREDTPLAPNSPYSASKAAADLLVRAAVRTYGLRGMVVRSSNAYGPYQFPEKLIPLMILQAAEGNRLPVYGDGLHVRDWVHVEDLVAAIGLVLQRGQPGDIFNVGGASEMPNLDVVRMIVEMTGASESQIELVEDRPGHDRRYAMDFSRLEAALGWRPTRSFREGLRDTIAWYEAHQDWLHAVRTGKYRDFYRQQYGNRLALP